MIAGTWRTSNERILIKPEPERFFDGDYTKHQSSQTQVKKIQLSYHDDILLRIYYSISHTGILKVHMYLAWNVSID